MKRLQEHEIASVLTYLKKNIEDCLYLYIDITIYGLDNSNMLVWIDKKDEQINTVVMKYFDSFQIYSEFEEWNEEGVLDLILEYGITTISGKKSIIERLASRLEGIYSTAYGVVIKEDRYREFKQFEQVEQATESDVQEIAELMCTDEEFGHNYSVDVLAKQLEDRIRTHMGRNFVIRQDGKIVAHVGVFAETDDVAIESGLIVSREAGRSLLGIVIHEYIKKKLILEGKSVFAFRIKDNMLRCTNVASVAICSEYGKMTKETK